MFVVYKLYIYNIVNILILLVFAVDVLYINKIFEKKTHHYIGVICGIDYKYWQKKKNWMGGVIS